MRIHFKVYVSLYMCWWYSLHLHKLLFYF